MDLFAAILLGIIMGGLLLYFCLPDESFKAWKKRKQGIARMNNILAEAVSIPCPPAPSPTSQGLLVPPAPLLHQHREPAWHHERIETFYRKYVAPHRKVLENAGHLGSINTLLDLLDQHGDCPSVVRLDDDKEYQQIRNSYDLLAKITLLDHSLNVAEQMVRAVLQTRTKDPELLMGKILVTALGHDIGKIPELTETRKYSKGDHPYLSYLVLKTAIFTEDSPQQQNILKAVREHHYPVKEGFSFDLRRADQAAREMETERLSLQGKATAGLVQVIQEQKISEETHADERGTKTSKPKKKATPRLLDLSWLDPDEFLSAVESRINVERTGRFQAFSMQNGLVYLMLSLVVEIVVQLAKKHDRPEVLVNADTKEKMVSIEYAVKTLLKKQGLIPSFIGEEYIGAKFAVARQGSSKKSIGFYLPVEARAFKTPLRNLEKRKKNAPAIKKILDVRPLIAKKK